MALYTKEAKSTAIKNEQEVYHKFHSMIKTMDSIVFLGYGEDDNYSRDIIINAECLCLLNYFLWKALMESNKPRISYSPIHLLAPLMRSIIPATKDTEYKDCVFDIFQTISTSSASTVFQLKQALTKELGAWGRRKTVKDPVLYIELYASFKSCIVNDIDVTKEIFTSGSKGLIAEIANKKLSLVLIITAFLCRAKSELNDAESYAKNLSILLRLALVLDGANIVGEAKSFYPTIAKKVENLYMTYRSLIVKADSDSKKIRTTMAFVFELDFNKEEDTLQLLLIEKELFRITRKLCYLGDCSTDKKCVDESCAENKENTTEKSCHAPSRLKQVIKNINVEDKVPKLKQLIREIFECTIPANTFLGIDEENFYYILSLIY